MQGKGVYPEGIASGYFGQITKNALIKFQEVYATEILYPERLNKGTGSVGGKTRAKMNQLLGK